MAPLGPDTGEIIRIAIYFAFFWTIIGIYAYREARKEGRSSPELQGAGWGLLGLLGAIKYVFGRSEYDSRQLKWLGLVALLVTFWLIGTVGQGKFGAWYPWAGFYAGLFVLYVNFGLNALAGATERSTAV